MFERVLSPWVANLKRIGVAATIRQVDSAQYQSRLNDYEFDVILARFTLGATPLDGLNQFFGSKAAGEPGSHNYAGVKSQAVDGLLARLPAVTSRVELVTLLKAVDRVLRAGQYGTPSWYQRQPPGRPLGHLRLAGGKAGLRLHAGDDLVVRRGQGGGDRL